MGSGGMRKGTDHPMRGMKRIRWALVVQAARLGGHEDAVLDCHPEYVAAMEGVRGMSC